MELDDCIKKRHSVRTFKAKKPDYGKIFEAIECAIKAPTAGNIPTMKFILVSKKETIQELADAATQDFVSAVHYVVVVCSDNSNCIRSYGDRGEIYSLQQAGSAIQNFLLKIADLGLATCWVGAFSDKTVKRVLKIPNHVRVDGLFPIGYEMGKETQRKKPSLDSSIYFDMWNNEYMKPIRKPEAG
jgi:nitroreductase